MNDPWYVAVPIGKNVLAKMVSTMCDEAGISGKKTNHSLRVSGATSLFDAGVPERQRTGHRSIEGLRIYERITDEQEMAVSKLLTGESKRYDDCRGKKDCLDEISINTGTVVNGTNKGNVSSSSSDVKEMDQSRLGTQYNNCNVNFYSTPASHYPPYPPSHYWSHVCV